LALFAFLVGISANQIVVNIHDTGWLQNNKYGSVGIPEVCHYRL